MSNDPKLTAFHKIIVARTLSNWKTSDGSVAVQLANPSTDGVTLPTGLCLGHLFLVSLVVASDQLHANTVANTPQSAAELSHARSGLWRSFIKNVR